MSQEQLEKMRDDLRLNEIKTRLLTIPGEIKEKQIQLSVVREKIEVAQAVMKEREAETIFMIKEEIEEVNGKPRKKFGNDQTRTAELTKRMADDFRFADRGEGEANFLDAYEALKELQPEQRDLDIDIDRLRNDFRVQMALKDLACAEMQLLGA